MTELLPCPNPWCDGRPKYLYGRLRDDGMRYVCAKCGIGPALAPTEAAAIAAWNTRPEPPLHGYAESVNAIAARLINQSDEPWPRGSQGDRVHYWRDKAIHAAQALAALIPKEPKP